MGKVFFISGVGLIALSGILYTAERLISVFYFTIDSFPEKLMTGTYQGELIKPGIFDNIFVGILLVLGITNMLFGLVDLLKQKNDF